MSRKWQPWILPLVMSGLLSAVYFLPQAASMADCAVRMDLPAQEDDWIFRTIPASQKELDALAKDTQFSKAMCFRPRPGELSLQGEQIPDRIDLSVVMSGSDLNNSIHRPERCMPAQGHDIVSSSDREITLHDGKTIKVKRLLSTQRLNRDPASGGEPLRFDCVTYYFFVGHNQITNSHLDRTRIDIMDRLFLGRDQHWAYVSMSMWYGKVPWIEKPIPEKEADEKLSAFLANFSEKQMKWDQIRQ